MNERRCEELELRLVDGVRPADDRELAEHIGSCLRCFRTAADLRDLPRMEALLRKEPPFDPGPAFWARFPTQVAEAWERTRRPAEAPVSWLDRVRAVFRMPVPAAFAGAALAVSLMLLVGERSARSPGAAPADPAPVVAAPDDDDDPAGLATLLGGTAPWESLEIADLERLLAEVELATTDDDDDHGPVFPRSAAEELEELDTDDLHAVALALSEGGRF